MLSVPELAEGPYFNRTVRKKTSLRIKMPNFITDHQYKARRIFSHFRGLQTKGKCNFGKVYLNGGTRRKTRDAESEQQASLAGTQSEGINQVELETV